MQRECRGNSGHPRLAYSELVSKGNANAAKTSSASESTRKSASPTRSAKPSSSNTPQTQSAGVPLIREALNQYNLSENAKSILMASWRTGTTKQYKTYLTKWEFYCKANGLDVFKPGLEQAVDFLSYLFQEGLGYSGVNTARSALSTILALQDGFKFGEHPLVCRFMKGVFELKPALPKYKEVWQVSTVIDYLKTTKPAGQLNLKDLSQKLAMLLCLTTGQRCQTIHLIEINGLQVLQGKFRLTTTHKLKQTKPGRHIDPIELIEFKEDGKLCVVEHLKEYLERTQKLRGVHTQLFLSFIRPYRPVTKDTISRWVKSVLQQAGVDVTKYSAHSSRAATTSHTKQKGLSLQEIMKTAGWTSTTTFEKFYHKPIKTPKNFGQTVLE